MGSNVDFRNPRLSDTLFFLVIFSNALPWSCYKEDYVVVQYTSSVMQCQSTRHLSILSPSFSIFFVVCLDFLRCGRKGGCILHFQVSYVLFGHFPDIFQRSS